MKNLIWFIFILPLLFVSVLCKEAPCSRVSFILFSDAIHTAPYTVMFHGRAETSLPFGEQGHFNFWTGADGCLVPKDFLSYHKQVCSSLWIVLCPWIPLWVPQEVLPEVATGLHTAKATGFCTIFQTVKFKKGEVNINECNHTILTSW